MELIRDKEEQIIGLLEEGKTCYNPTFLQKLTLFVSKLLLHGLMVKCSNFWKCISRCFTNHLPKMKHLIINVKGLR